MRESAVLARVRLALSGAGFVMFRNNIGQYKNDAGHVIRYGVSNPGGSDLLGWLSITITPGMVGKQIAQFVAVECKAEGGKLSVQQQNFLRQVKLAGGVARVAWGENNMEEI